MTVIERKDFMNKMSNEILEVVFWLINKQKDILILGQIIYINFSTIFPEPTNI